MAVDHLYPTVPDGYGYLARQRDLDFLNIGDTEYKRWIARESPLGMSHRQYEHLCDQLRVALEADGIDIGSVDIRIKGSSVNFFSGHHKFLPTTRAAITEEFRQHRRRLPTAGELDDIFDRLLVEWIDDGDFPRRRPFDAFHRLGISREPSDYDLQICSDDIVDRCRALVTELGISPDQVQTNHPVYAFVLKDLVEAAVPRLYLATLRLSDVLQRNVSVAVFPASGPPDTSGIVGELSAHRRPSDWVIQLSTLEDVTLQELPERPI